ncbi:hypothetical protein GVAV_003453 [Gurleya vavrai]
MTDIDQSELDFILDQLFITKAYKKKNLEKNYMNNRKVLEIRLKLLDTLKIADDTITNQKLIEKEKDDIIINANERNHALSCKINDRNKWIPPNNRAFSILQNKNHDASVKNNNEINRHRDECLQCKAISKKNNEEYFNNIRDNYIKKNDHKDLDKNGNGNEDILNFSIDVNSNNKNNKINDMNQSFKNFSKLFNDNNNKFTFERKLHEESFKFKKRLDEYIQNKVQLKDRISKENFNFSILCNENEDKNFISFESDYQKKTVYNYFGNEPIDNGKNSFEKFLNNSIEKKF